MGGRLTPLRWLIVIALAFGPSCLGFAADNPKSDPSRIGERNVSKGPNFYSIQKEIALGRQLAAEVERQARILSDPIISEYVNRIGQNIARNSDANYPFTFKILDDDSVNAFALPGGYVFINSGLIEVAEDESELAGAIAHEVAHVAARHMTRQATRSDLLSMARVPVSVIL
jgi:predicted Zn-dependent protease